MSKEDLKSLNYQELQEYTGKMGEKPFRARQLYQWMHEKLAENFQEMSNLPAAFRGRLEEETTLTVLRPVEVRTSALDGTQTAALSGLPCDAAHATQAYGFFENWLRRDREGLIGICYWVEERFGVEDCLRRMDREALMRMRVFPAADTILLDAALNSFAQGRLNLDDAEELLRARRDQAWSEEYAAYYRALRALTDMQRFHMAHRGGYHATALMELWTAYADEMYRMDQYYREFCVACDQAMELMQMVLEDSLKAAAETADRMYKNSYLGELNALWTRLVSEQGLDELTGVARQTDFYRDRVAPAENRVYVIISDGLRY